MGEGLAVLKIRAPGRSHHIVLTSEGGRSAAGLVEADDLRARFGARFPSFVARERAREAALDGARVTALDASGLSLDVGGVPRRVEVRGERVAIGDGSAAGPADADEPALRAAGLRLLDGLGAAALARRRTDALRDLGRARAKVARRVAAVRADLERVHEADVTLRLAGTLAAAASRLPRGTREVAYVDWSTGEPSPRTLAVDPSRAPRDVVEALVRRSKRLKLAEPFARRRLDEAVRALEALEAAAGEVDAAPSFDALAAALSSARAVAPRELSGVARATAPGAAPAAPPGRVPFRTFHGSGDARILVGKGARDNDALTFRTARPHDLWLHAKDRAGSHVIVPVARGHAAPDPLVIDAATLAAHFSDARGESVVDVQIAERRHLRKPRGAAPGLVVVDRERVVAVRVDAARLAALLAGEG